MQTPFIHPLSSGRKLSFLIAPLLSGLMIGCAATAPRKIETSASPSTLFQLTDHDWLDLNDIWVIQFQRSDANSSDADAFAINIWRKASETPITFGFADEASAYGAYKRLAMRLGGSVKEDHWTRPAETAKPAAAVLSPTPVPAAAPPPPAPATQPSQSVVANHPLDPSDPYVALAQGLTDLARCRDEKLITDAEYLRVRDATVDAFGIRVAEGGRGYDTGFAQLYSELTQVQLMKKNHLLSDEQITAMREKIATRYGLIAAQNP